MRPDSMRVLNDKIARTSLSRYFDVMQNNKIAKFIIAKNLMAKFTILDSTSKLWNLHQKLTKNFSKLEKNLDRRIRTINDLDTPSQSFLDLKVEIAKRILRDCHFCERRCRINRMEDERGYCKCGSQITISTIFEHMGEEPELVPSGTIFTLGCTMRCLHCQNWTISQWMEPGEIYTVKNLAKSIDHLRLQGCRNVNLVGGDPTPWLANWLETFKHVEENIPIVWNSNAYYSKETAILLSCFADVYLLDFKYGNNKCSQRLSNAPDYWETCTRNHMEAMKCGDLIIRVLVLPGHLTCCTKKILNWISKRLGSLTRTNIMFQYRPEWRANEIKELRRRLTTGEMEKALEIAKNVGLRNVIT